MRVLVTGAGLSGATAAYLLRRAGHEVEVFDSRSHTGGNCHDEVQDGVRVHRYGPHLFHTNHEGVWRFLSRFTEWSDYRHRVMASTRIGLLSIPWSRVTARQAGKNLTDAEIRDLIFVDYSEKQWGIPFKTLPGAIRNRVPLRRDNEDTRYFTDRFQGQPKNGYAAIFREMLNGIPVHIGCRPDQWRKQRKKADLHIYTGKIDSFFGHCCGVLPYRSLRFENQRTRARLPHAVINQCNRLPFTRVYDHGRFSERIAGSAASQETVITYEYPQPHDETNEPYYPMPFGNGLKIYLKYKAMAAAQSGTVFTGRQATYCYLDMWMAAAQVFTRLRSLLLSADRAELLDCCRASGEQAPQRAA